MRLEIRLRHWKFQLTKKCNSIPSEDSPANRDPPWHDARSAWAHFAKIKRWIQTDLNFVFGSIMHDNYA